ncbi:MAG: methionyl-tRNA formyltransferase [Clostridiales Family XIII bacterium]|nr:methionyl-tRNA formyltransferase [Clostridiales Family XIII bacterium]
MGKSSRPVIVYFGSSGFAVPALRALHRTGAYIAYVVTQPDRVRARGGKTLPTPVKAAALEYGLNVLEPERIRGNADFQEALKNAAPDLLVVASYGKILPKETLDLPAHGAVNIHASLLPEYRGAAPIQRAIMDGREETGVSLMLMGEGLDDGAVIAAVRVGVSDLDAGALTERLAEAGADLLLKFLPRLLNGSASSVAQDETKATYAAKIEKSDARVDFTKSAEKIVRLVRAMSPAPGAYALRGGKDGHSEGGEERIGIAKARVAEAAEATAVTGATENKAAPGQVVKVSDEGIFVGTGEGLLVIEEVKMPGKRVMTVADYLRGNTLPTEPLFD